MVANLVTGLVSAVIVARGSQWPAASGAPMTLTGRVAGRWEMARESLLAALDEPQWRAPAS